jgi:uncharacterized protein YecT (DUF1311 family)
MRLGLSLAVFALIVLIADAAAAQSPVWYWCDAFRGYYPWVGWCPTGWRPVNPTSVFPQMYGAAAPAKAQPAPPQAPTAAPYSPSGTTSKFPALGDSLDPWCAQVKLSSSIAICSDAELRALAVERQHAYDEARSRLNPDQQKALLTDQNGWVKTYPQACGVHPNVAPSLPLEGNIKSCMAQAGRARIAYLRAFGETVGAAPAPAPAPSVPNNTNNVAARTLVGKWCEQRDGKLMEPVDIAVAATGDRVYAEGFVPEMHMTVQRAGDDVTMISASGGVRYELRDNDTLETTVSGVRRVYIRCNPQETTTASATAPTTTEKTPDKQGDHNDFDHDYQLLQTSGERLVAAGALRYSISGWHSSLDITLPDLSAAKASAIAEGACNHSTDLRGEWSEIREAHRVTKANEARGKMVVVHSLIARAGPRIGPPWHWHLYFINDRCYRRFPAIRYHRDE